ncbi:DUF3320 domain-containing protein [Gordonia amarae]|uniref:Uncharacterized protein n=2 Tax=Gordonia amarae TaxID=36821 RepID=G7GQ49_9ACTN|nr:DUF3320 domain-containing protein [Gordonia amarae]MCS3876773.1 hypothetical protein [Gordonia amarae]QHN15619.1 DUF3320 domain-containing protein [Gordonia amarae]QHN20188.1 DUF3320 domain-containing protein [Gordonia amarae]QHN29039.1 DUF3320 domain-containing protein [Gordonia amarae]QHN37820.1 DUF3320 domain-containing protein [Gordonia amarae]
MATTSQAFKPRHCIDEGLTHLATRLDPIIGRVLEPSLGGLPWPAILTQLDKMSNKPPKTYTSNDLQSQLRMLTERLGQLGFPFDDHSRLVSTLGNELRIVRNRWAHHDDLTTLDAWRTNDFAVRLLERLGDDEGAAAARGLRDEAFFALVADKVDAGYFSAPVTPPAEPTVPIGGPAPDTEIVRPDPSVLTRPDDADTPTIGSGRAEFQPWAVVLVGDVDVLDDLPKKAAKEKVRAVATEIADVEGPIHLDRLAQLTAASFGMKRLRAKREQKLVYQIKQTDLFVDGDKFVWPSGLDPKSWNEFRPNDSTVDRPFTEISPVEIANAMRLLHSLNPGFGDGELDAATLQTFGRKRRTKQFAAHLAKARALL